MQYSIEEVRSFNNLELLARQLVEGYITGLHKSPYHGFSVEFAEHRQYNTGESTRFIDWRIFARTDKLYVKQFEEETNLRCQILLDVSPSMFYPEKSLEKIVFSVLSASSLTLLMEKQRDAVGLVSFSDSIKHASAVKSNRRHIHELIVYLRRVLDMKPEGYTTKIDSVLHEMAELSKPRSLIVLFTDFFENQSSLEDLRQALSHMKYKKHEVIVFNVFSRILEREFDFQDRNTEFVDVETNEKIRVNPFEIKKSYKKKILDFQEGIKDICGDLKIDFHDAPIEEGFYPVFSKFLLKRVKMP